MLTTCKILVYISALVFITPYCFGEENIQLEPVVVTASRIYPKKSDERRTTRSQDSIMFEEKDALSHFSVAPALKKFSLTDVRTRGPYGVQGDISLRGAPFEQNLVLLDGLSINDPKSGHHNMDLPLTLYDIERIDVTYGPASSVYGSAALGGAINIIPRKPEDELQFFVSSSIGSWDFYSGGASLNIPFGIVKNRTSVEWKKSTGFAPETEFDMLTASSYSEVTLDEGKFDIFLGYLTKEFGADSFYSNLYPNEEESINTGILIARGEVSTGGEKDTVSIKPLFYWKRLQDKFILDRDRRSFSRNDHTTNLYGGEISSQVETGFGNVVFGASLGSEEVSSTNLGEHYRIKESAFLEYENRFSNFLLNASCRMDYYSTFGFEFCPSCNIGYEVFPGFAVRAGAARAFRAPTFTDLYYSSVANKGNPDLNPEEAWTYDAGFNYTGPGITLSGTIFLRNTENAIDWTRTSASSAWKAENIGEFDMYGMESSFTLELGKFMDAPFLKSVTLKYGYLEGLDKKGVTSKYVLEYLKHNLNLSFECELPFGFTQEIGLAFRKRMGSEKYFLLDSVIYKDVELKKGKMTFFVKLSNILDTEYSEQGDIEMPGMALFGGASVKF